LVTIWRWLRSRLVLHHLVHKEYRRRGNMGFFFWLWGIAFSCELQNKSKCKLIHSETILACKFAQTIIYKPYMVHLCSSIYLLIRILVHPYSSLLFSFPFYYYNRQDSLARHFWINSKIFNFACMRIINCDCTPELSTFSCQNILNFDSAS